MNKLVFYIACLCLLCHTVVIQAEISPDSTFQLGVDAYKSKNYTKAIEHFSTVEKEGYKSAALFLNLGNAYLQSKNTAKSVLYFERGLKMSPNNKSLLQNLKIAENKVETNVFEVESFFLTRYWRSFSNLLSVNVWSILQIVLLIVFTLCLWNFLFQKVKEKRKQAFVIGLLSLFFLLLTSLALITRYNLSQSTSDAILMDSSIVYSSPDIRSDTIQILQPGVKMSIKDNIDDWYKVSMLNQQQGWLKQNKLEKI